MQSLISNLTFFDFQTTRALLKTERFIKQYKYCNKFFSNNLHYREIYLFNSVSRTTAAYRSLQPCPSLYAFSKAKKAALTNSTYRMVGVPGLEPGTSSLSGTRSNQLSYTPINKLSEQSDMSDLSDHFLNGGATGTRTLDIQLAKLALYQLSYSPIIIDN